MSLGLWTPSGVVTQGSFIGSIGGSVDETSKALAGALALPVSSELYTENQLQKAIADPAAWLTAKNDSLKGLLGGVAADGSIAKMMKDNLTILAKAEYLGDGANPSALKPEFKALANQIATEMTKLDVAKMKMLHNLQFNEEVEQKATKKLKKKGDVK